ncbi:MAG: homoserine O-succinyltransferase [Treponema sp.]|uniref:homoserine O-acetyltransferase MetA n=1 Tax=Treponema sp. TaxID=166 RepID=UPI001DFB7A90|nr:homoserine O-succinyltransferase [Treponema sp.]MBS7310917.1 homoserine O-succinyltransferase [Treponema sp.]MDD5811089.1 homoserine O-succinyltransferase [Treponema sp.]
MPIKIDSDLPACKVLESENIFVMTGSRAVSQDIRPLKIAIVNLMPTKVTTETQLLRLLGNTPLQIEISLVQMENHVSKNVGTDHLEKFYINSSDVFKQKFDGMIITGAPVEQLPFEDVDYWNDLCKIMDYAKTNVFSTLYICWGAQAGLYHHYGVPKYGLNQKLFGIYKNKRSTGPDPLLRGFDDLFPIPQSRHTTIKKEDIIKHDDLVILAENKDIGPTIIKTKDNRAIFMTGHLEYDSETLKTEYFRDVDKGLEINIPVNYFPFDDPSKEPYSSWRSTAHLFYSNWLNYYVYQETPFNFVK